MTNTEMRQQALERATTEQSVANYPAIFEGFAEMGLDEADIRPRENVFTYQAWQALGRQVRRGEHGVKVVTWVEMSKTDETSGERETFRRPRMTTVFHVSQTDLVC